MVFPPTSLPILKLNLWKRKNLIFLANKWNGSTKQAKKQLTCADEVPLWALSFSCGRLGKCCCSSRELLLTPRLSASDMVDSFFKTDRCIVYSVKFNLPKFDAELANFCSHHCLGSAFCPFPRWISAVTFLAPRMKFNIASFFFSYNNNFIYCCCVWAVKWSVGHCVVHPNFIIGDQLLSTQISRPTSWQANKYFKTSHTPLFPTV
jgi:hypothetical protein